MRRSAEMGEAAAGLLSRTFFGGAGCSWSLIGKMRPDATIHWGMCTLNVQRVVGPEEDGVIQMVGSRRKKRRKTKSSDRWAGRGVICTRTGARWAADVCKALPNKSYSLLCSWTSGRNEVRARGGMDRLWTEGLDVRAASVRMQGTRQPRMRWRGMELRDGTQVPGGREGG